MSCSTSSGSCIYDLNNRGNRFTLGAKASGRNLILGKISHLLADQWTSDFRGRLSDVPQTSKLRSTRGLSEGRNVIMWGRRILTSHRRLSVDVSQTSVRGRPTDV